MNDLCKLKMLPYFQILLITCLSILFLRAGDITIPITADTSISTYFHGKTNERNLNAGASPRLKLKGLENLVLINYDVTPLRHHIIENATLHMKATAANAMVARIGLSTVATPWMEGTSQYKPAQNGESTYLHAGEQPWAGTQSCFLDAVFARGGTIWTQGKVAHDNAQWYHVPFDGRLLEACAAELSYGLALSDDNGQTMNVSKVINPQSNSSNNYFFSREQGNAKPYITALIKPALTQQAKQLAVTVEPWPAGATTTHGALRVQWPSAVDEHINVLGYRIVLTIDGKIITVPRWQLPTVAPAGSIVQALLTELPPDTKIAAQVEVIGRGGVIHAQGTGNNSSSAALKFPDALTLEKLPVREAGSPPHNAAGGVFVIPDLAQVNPITGTILEEPGAKYLDKKNGLWSQANPVWSGKNKTITLSAARGEWVAIQCVCQATQPATTWSITSSDFTGPNNTTISANAVRLSRAWYQKKNDHDLAWYADPLVPLTATSSFTIPDERNAVPGQTHQAVYVEWYIPENYPPGTYNGQLLITNNAGALPPLAVELTVGPATIPKTTIFTWSMNAYSSPGAGFGKAGSPEFISAERDFYRVAHEHRTTLAILGYSHAADFQHEVAWPLTGTGDKMRVSDWSAWDARFGPLFDGSAFADTPRAGIPIDHFYLPFMESYPTPMAAGYKWNDLKWEEHWHAAGPIEEGFNALYKQQWVSVMRDAIKHFKDKKWQTKFQVYLNDKYFYKQYDDKKKKHGRGTSFWLLDEPQHIDDFLALAFFGRLIREAQGTDRTIVHRVDVSRPQWGRDLLDRVVDVNVSGGFSEFAPWLHDWHNRYQQTIWTYGGAPSSSRSAVGIAHQALDLYTRGVDGFVPWLTLGNENNWTQPADTCVFYSGKPFGITGACASLRLKAYRRGEQDVSLLHNYATKNKIISDPQRRPLAALLTSIIGGKISYGALDAQGAVTEFTDDIDLEKLETLRVALRTISP